jgi:hypothetical protein
MAVERVSIPDPPTAWVRSTMTEAKKTTWVRSTMTEVKIQALVDRGLLRSKEEVEWRVATGE